MNKYIDTKELLSYDAESLVLIISSLESEINFLTTLINRIEAEHKLNNYWQQQK